VDSITERVLLLYLLGQRVVVIALTIVMMMMMMMMMMELYLFCLLFIDESFELAVRSADSDSAQSSNGTSYRHFL